MKKSITNYGLVLLLTMPLFISCSLLESNTDKANDTVNMSCNRKGPQTLATKNIHPVKGMAHVYKKSQQGKQAAGCDVIDMNSFTAAHPTLPLPSHIKITNSQTNKSVVVKVNDRSPAQHAAVLLVTPAVASLLGAKSSFPVVIDVIPTKTKALPIHPIINKTTKAETSPKTDRRISASRVRYYIVVGTYASQEEALAKFTRLSSMGIDNATMETRRKQDRLLHMVRIGPFYQQDTIDKVKNQLQSNGLVKFTVVKN